MDEFFERAYSIQVPKLASGPNEEEFEIDRSFFEAFEFSPIEEGSLTVKAVITKMDSHLDATFSFDGTIELHCDRCTEPYPHPLSFSRRVVFAFEEGMEDLNDEVILVDKEAPNIFLGADFYDFIVLEIPFRKVPSKEIHLCDPRVLEILGLSPEGEEIETEEPNAVEEEPGDPRWEALKNLKDKEE